MKGFPLALAVVAGFNTVIALLLTLGGYAGLRENFVFSQCIGLSVLAIVDVGRRVIFRGQPPRTIPMIALVALAIVGGWLAGTLIASAILGLPWQPGLAGGTALAITA